MLSVRTMPKRILTGMLSRKIVTRTRLKQRNFGIFRLVIFARRQPCFIFRTKICSKFHLFKVKEFSKREFLVAQGKNAGNPDGLPSILTQRKRKFTFENRGSDYSLSAIHRCDSPYHIISCCRLISRYR